MKSKFPTVSLLLVGGAIIAIGSEYYYSSFEHPLPEAVPVTVIETNQFYTSHISNLEFSYKKTPNGYVQVKDIDNSSDSLVDSVVLFNEKEYEELQNREYPSEYPPSTTIGVYKNPDQLNAVGWAKENNLLSNYQMNEGGDTVVNVANAEGISYSINGLYRFDIFVLAYKDEMYLLSGNYYEVGDERQEDFKKLIASAVFQ